MEYNLFMDKRGENEIKKILKKDGFENHGGTEFPYHKENIQLRYNLDGTKICIGGEDIEIKQLKKLADIFDAIEVRTKHNAPISLE